MSRTVAIINATYDEEPDMDANEDEHETTDKPVVKRGRGFAEKRDDDVQYHPDDGDLQPQKSVEGWIIFVRNVHEESSEEDILDKFSEYGEILNMHLSFDRKTGLAKGYCLVEYKEYAEARAALENLNGAQLYGKSLKVTWAFLKPPESMTARSKRTVIATTGSRIAGRLGDRTKRSRSRSPERR